MGKKERYGIIYKITNTVNGKVYIGQTTKSFNRRYSFSGKGIERVYRHHKYRKEHNKHYNTHLLRSIEKYGLEAFDVIEEFDVAYSEEELNDLEKNYIKEFDCIENGYNHEEGGSNGKPSEETCKKMSEKARERMNDPELRRKQSETMKGRYCGENNPNYGNGYKISGGNNPFYGKKHSEEVCKKISKKARERCKDPYVRRKMSERMKGKYVGGNHPRARKVICLNDNKIFDTIKECVEYYKSNINTIRRICKGEQKSTRTGLVFMYYDEYLQQEQTA